MMTWSRLLMCWVAVGGDGPFGPGRSNGREIVYVDRAQGVGLFVTPGAPRMNRSDGLWPA